MDIVFNSDVILSLMVSCNYVSRCVLFYKVYDAFVLSHIFYDGFDSQQILSIVYSHFAFWAV